MTARTIVAAILHFALHGALLAGLLVWIVRQRHLGLLTHAGWREWLLLALALLAVPALPVFGILAARRTTLRPAWWVLLPLSLLGLGLQGQIAESRALPESVAGHGFAYDQRIRIFAAGLAESLDVGSFGLVAAIATFVGLGALFAARATATADGDRAGRAATGAFIGAALGVAVLSVPLTTCGAPTRALLPTFGLSLAATIMIVLAARTPTPASQNPWSANLLASALCQIAAVALLCALTDQLALTTAVQALGGETMNASAVPGAVRAALELRRWPQTTQPFFALPPLCAAIGAVIAGRAFAGLRAALLLLLGVAAAAATAVALGTASRTDALDELSRLAARALPSDISPIVDPHCNDTGRSTDYTLFAGSRELLGQARDDEPKKLGPSTALDADCSELLRPVRNQKPIRIRIVLDRKTKFGRMLCLLRGLRDPARPLPKRPFDRDGPDVTWSTAPGTDGIPPPFARLVESRACNVVLPTEALRRADEQYVYLATRGWQHDLGGVVQTFPGSREARLRALASKLAPERLRFAADPDVLAEDVFRVAALAPQRAILSIDRPAQTVRDLRPRGLTLESEVSVVSGGISAANALAAVEASNDEFRDCHEQRWEDSFARSAPAAVRRDPPPAGVVATRIVVDEYGNVVNVGDAGSNLRDAVVVGCVQRAHYRLRLSNPERRVAVLVHRLTFGTD